MNAVWDLHVCGRLEWGLLLNTLLLPQHHDKRERGGLLTDLCSDFSSASNSAAAKDI